MHHLRYAASTIISNSIVTSPQQDEQQLLTIVNVSHVRHLFGAYGVLPAAIWAVTLILVVTEDLLTGVLVGIALSLLELVPNLRNLRLKVDRDDDAGGHNVRLSGGATFITLPRLSDTLDAVPTTGVVRLDVSRLRAMDHTCAELLKEWLVRRRASGFAVELHGASGKTAALAH